MAVWLLLGIAFAIIIVRPFIVYFYDPKGLRRYPNQNILSPFTNLAYVWERSDNFRTRRLYRQHQKYPIIRTGPATISFGSVEAINDIYGHGTPCLKYETYQMTAGSHSNILNVIDRDEHSRKRRMLSNAFATRNLEQWEFKISDKVERLLKQLDQRCTPVLSEVNPAAAQDFNIEWRLWSNLFTIEAIADIALSENLGMLESGCDTIRVANSEGLGARILRFLQSLHGGARISSRFVGAPDWFPFLKTATKFFVPSIRQQWEHGQNFGTIVSYLVGKRLRRGDSGDNLDDFLACLIQDRLGKPRSLDRGEIEAEINILLDAGSDTTAIALVHILYYLVRNPHVLIKLRSEVAEALDGELIAPYAKVKSLPYLRACLEESLRLSPPLPRGLERKTPPSGMKIMGVWVPGNVGVSVPAYVSHRDPDLFPDPEKYVPERWLDGNVNISKMRAVFMPFSTGARACIGRNITMMEQQILVASLVYRYDFTLPSDDWELEYEEAFNLWPASMLMKFWRRPEVPLGPQS
ncbi:Cytochrome P450 [Aspergillus parasiticus SU-1]|uniref:Benzoate 4-monooxygenase cytochrome P450 n=2 Tax=Aspergillus parasiticus TaxID=5067 RepID=A0A5N6DHB6_ASPPA|nr:benzoate 4-monooxygenase cytochrome P450 [Aspergillus parasiticus]KJK61402.1 Cytochrome P450 [Aspergillus parasiticus SU-1]